MNVTIYQFYSFWDNVVLARFPNAKIKAKDKSMFMRFLGLILFFNKGFMTRYITTIGTTVYVPTQPYIESNPHSALVVCAHEFVHMCDEANTSLYKFKYLFPQILAVFSLLSLFAFINLYFLFFLAFLVCVAPWGSPGRTRIETSGYAMNMILHSFFGGTQYNACTDAKNLAGYFTTSKYYWMCRDYDRVVQTLFRKYKTYPQTHAAFREVLLWLKSHVSAK